MKLQTAKNCARTYDPPKIAEGHTAQYLQNVFKIRTVSAVISILKCEKFIFCVGNEAEIPGGAASSG